MSGELPEGTENWTKTFLKNEAYQLGGGMFLGFQVCDKLQCCNGRSQEDQQYGLRGRKRQMLKALNCVLSGMDGKHGYQSS